MVESTEIIARLAKSSDFEQLEPLLKINCERMQMQLEACSIAVKKIIEEPDFGVFIVAEKEAKIVGYIYFTYEWSDWRNGVLYYLQSLQADPNEDAGAIGQALKAYMDKHNATAEYKCVGIRLCSAKAVHKENEDVMKLFELVPTHYYVYNVDTN